MPTDAIDSFITRWENSGAAERANYQMFLSELCDIHADAAAGLKYEIHNLWWRPFEKMNAIPTV